MSRVVVGRVVGAHGLRGQLKVRDFTDGPESFAALRSVSLSRGDREDAGASDHEIEAAIPGRPGEIRLTLEGIHDRAGAEALRGRLVWADADQLEPLEPGEYYGFQLVGCRVEDTGGAVIGTVREVWSTGAADTLVIEDAAGREQLIPAAESFLKEVDLDARRLVVEVIPGLLDAGPEGDPARCEEALDGDDRDDRDEGE